MKRIGDYDEQYVKNKTPIGLTVKIVAIALAIGLIMLAGHFVFGWFKAATDVVGPTNVKSQWQFAYDYDASLKAVAQNWCTARKAELEETNTDAKIQRGTQRIAIEQNYARVKGEYDGRLRDAFRGGLVAPPDVPKQAPDLKTAVDAVGCMN